MKKLGILLSLAMFISVLTACGNTAESKTENSKDSTSESKTESTAESTTESTSESKTESTAKSTEDSTEDSAQDSTQTAVLYAVFHSDNVKEYPIEYTGEQKTAEELANELSTLTGLNFNITASKVDDGWSVDWAADSTLIAGLDGGEQKEEFRFFDVDSMSWFMMDSLWRTLTENLDAENIYYTMDGGKTLTFEYLSAANEFPSDTPYMGSDFYYAHAEGQGDDETPAVGEAAYQGFWEYSNGKILEINGEVWRLYADDKATLLDNGPVTYDEEAAYLINADGSSGGSKVYFDENNNLVDSGYVLTYHGDSL